MVHKWKHPVHKEIYERIRVSRYNHGENWKEEYFNNFRMLMPSQGEFNWRFNEKYLDKPHFGFDWKSCNEKLGYKRYSDLLGNQTTREFKEMIEEVIKISERTDEQLTDAVWQKKGIEYAFKIFFPIYFGLRKKGYSECELQV